MQSGATPRSRAAAEDITDVGAGPDQGPLARSPAIRPGRGGGECGGKIPAPFRERTRKGNRRIWRGRRGGGAAGRRGPGPAIFTSLELHPAPSSTLTTLPLPSPPPPPPLPSSSRSRVSLWHAVATLLLAAAFLPRHFKTGATTSLWGAPHTGAAAELETAREIFQPNVNVEVFLPYMSTTTLGCRSSSSSPLLLTSIHHAAYIIDIPPCIAKLQKVCTCPCVGMRAHCPDGAPASSAAITAESAFARGTGGVLVRGT